MDLDGKVVVITAGGGGIGRAVAVALAQEGMGVVAADIAADAAERTAAAVEDAGGRAAAVVCDVESDADMVRLADRTISQFGRVDVLMNHAGIAVSGPFDRVPLHEWQRILDFNVVTMVRGTQVFLPHLAATRGRVVNTTSSLAVLGGHPRAGLASPYVASKAAVIGLTQSLAMALQPQGIGVSLFAPDYTDTGFDRTGARYRSGSGPADGPPGSPRPARSPRPPWSEPPPQSPEHVASVLVDGLRHDRFLISSTPDVADHLARQAAALLDPASLTGIYVQPPDG